jgi:Secretion system C-terminal sorting domain
MKRVIFFVLLPIINLLSYSQNLVLNPGFETWEKTNKPAGWTTAQNCLKDSDNIKSGSYSCRQDGGTKYLKSEIWQRFSVDFTVPAGASAFYLEVRTYQNSIAWFDDFGFDENVTTFDQQQHVRDVKVYPDPAHDFITISNLSDLQHIYIQSLMGTLLWSSGPCSEQTVTISVSGLADGIYIVRILTSNKLITKIFIKKAY